MPAPTNTDSRIAELSPKRLALLALELRARLDAQERARREPIAIVGLGCRFPGGADNPAEYWDLLRRGANAVVPVPPSRWDQGAYFDAEPGKPGKTYSQHGGFLSGIDQFDAGFFGISPRECAGMDPQHRLLLEVSWEALEHAGQAPDQLAGSETGVFVGVGHHEYAQLGVAAGDLSRIDAYLSTGNTASAAAGRISYILGLQGPSLAVDTACSSSLVAVHLACQSLRNGECAMALAGGVNLILAPTSMLALSALRLLAPDGRCKAFDARADGFVRGEGCGLVVLKRLTDAERAGDRVLAVILGSAVNQDGRSNGLTAPNGPAQTRVLRRALRVAGVLPHEVQYLEAHGTGTALGDPIELQALDEVLREGRSREAPLRIGSVKTNVGHLEAAAGIAGLLKVVLALEAGEIPPQLHFEQPNPHLNWGEMAVEVVTKGTAWREGRRVAGVSAFGVSGTNAHVVVEAGPARARAAGPHQGARAPAREEILVLSAKSKEALAKLVLRYIAFLSETTASWADICFTAAVGRAHFAHRVALTARSADEARTQLLDRGERLSRSVTVVGAEGPRLKVGGVIRGGAGGINETLDFSVLRRVRAENAALPAGLAGQLALLELWRSWGFTFWALAGSGGGEWAAAVAAGTLSSAEAERQISTSGLPPARESDRLRLAECPLQLEIDPADDRKRLLERLAEAYEAGASVHWAAVMEGSGRQKVALPTYPFARQAHWFETVHPAKMRKKTEWHVIQWREDAAAPPGTLDPGKGIWLVLAGRGKTGEALGALLRACGESVQVADHAAAALPGWWDQFGTSWLRGVVYLPSLEQGEAPYFGPEAEGILSVTAALARRRQSEPPRLWIATRQCQPVSRSSGLNPGPALFWGLGRVIGLEHPEIWGGLIDLDGGPPDEDARALCLQILADDGEDQVAFRQNRRYVARLARTDAVSVTSGSVLAEASYLISGGFGAMGFQFARTLVELGARRIMIMGRHPRPETKQEGVRQLEQAGARIIFLPGDVANPGDVERVFATIQREHPPLRGIVHAAGILDDGVLANQTGSRFRSVLGPKASGAWNLHCHSRLQPLDFFVLCSSTASLFGSAGQGNYAAANAYLDGLAHHRRALGLPGLSINWGPWSGEGMAAALGEERLRRWADQGIGAIAPELGRAHIRELLLTPAAQAAVVPIEWPKVGANFAHRSIPPLFADFVQTTANHRRSTSLSPIQRQLQSAGAEERLRLTTSLVRTELAAILGFGSGAAPALDEGFFELGLDSLMAVELKNRLQTGLGRNLPSTVIFDCANVPALARFLAGVVAAEQPARDPMTSGAARDRETILGEVESLSEDTLVAFIAEQFNATQKWKRP